LAAAMGQSELGADARFAAAADRNEHHAALDEIIGRWTATHSQAELESILQKAAVPATRIFTIEDIFNDPHYRARNSIVAAPDDAMGTVAMAGVVPRLSATPGVVRHAGRAVGQDTREVLGEMLGMTNADIDALAGSGAIAVRDVAAGPAGREVSA
jgi:crotonobetainyl-CoA:carnitine CoA-transferase CaiB-like acyl-CoA transferase